MKAINIIATVLTMSAAIWSLPAKAQSSTHGGYSPDGVVLTKNVVEGTDPNTYTINLETFVTGESITVKTGAPLDAVLVLDFSTSLKGDNWTNLQNAAGLFLEKIRDYKINYQADARVGVISFGNDASPLTNGIIDANSTESATLISQFKSHSFSTWGKTHIEKALEVANNWLSLDTRTDVNKCVVVFTDGKPEGDKSSAMIAKEALDYADIIKNTYGADIYTIGLLSSSDESALLTHTGCVTNKMQTTNPTNTNLTTGTFMDRLSSNYLNAFIARVSKVYNVDTGKTDLTKIDYADGWTTRNPKAEVSYYQLAETSTLESIFSNISESVIGGASYELKEATSTVIDVVSPAFKLPDGTDGSKINLYVAHCNGLQSIGPDGSKVFDFGAPVEVPNTQFPNVYAEVGVLTKTGTGADATMTFTAQPGGKAVSVKGFGFSENWVGQRSVESGPYYDGYKLIISFPIEIDPSNPGGATQNTNTEDSGVYTNDGSGYKQIGGFEIPTVKIPNIVVIKHGLRKGDSAIFNVYKVEKDGSKSKFPIVLVATCKNDGQPAIAKTKIMKTGRYMVEETTWSWAYGISSCQSSYPGHEDSSAITIDQWHEMGFGEEGESGYVATIPFKFGTEVTTNSITRNVNDFTEEETSEYKGTLFVFTNEPKANTPAHAETYNNNLFFETEL